MTNYSITIHYNAKKEFFETNNFQLQTGNSGLSVTLPPKTVAL